MTTIAKRDFRKVSDYLWEIPTSFRSEMRVPVWVYADDELLEDALGDASIQQAINVACLPGLIGKVVVMPDVHQGYGMPIGGVMAAPLPHGIISPGAVGYDINCGVRVLSTSIEFGEAEPYLSDLATSLYRSCPSGVGEKGTVRVSPDEFDQLCREGSEWALKRGYAQAEDLPRTEESGRIDGADPTKVSRRAKDRGRPQVGTL
ncbi:MAG: RtcB family protein, partial [Chloroflexi bacterium]|nr:RtcB family protein [Chloroflexota bacterium]